MTRGLLDWLADPSPTRGIRFALEPKGWELWTYERLARAAGHVARRLIESGAQRGDVVAIVIPTGPAFVAAFFGALRAGTTPAPLVPPGYFERRERYVQGTAELVAAHAQLVVTEPGLASIIDEVCARAGGVRSVAVALDDTGDDEVAAAPPPPVALLQFTSGSSGAQRAVCVSRDNLWANCRLICERIDWQEQDTGASWLPLYHDMGLIGCMVTPVTHQCDFWLMRPEQFVADPLRWLELFGCEGAAFSASPNFTFAYAVKKIAPERLEGMDFSGWRSVIVGAERLDAAVLGRFASLLEPHGFRPEVFLPAYGLAEATLAVTLGRPDAVAAAVLPAWDTMGFGEPVQVKDATVLGDARIDTAAGWLVGCGSPLSGVEVAIIDEERRELPRGCLGEVRVHGLTVAGGYRGAAAPVTSFEDGALITGDAAFVHDGELYVVGRLGDSLKVRGRTLYAEDLEAKLGAVPDVPLGRCAVVPGVHEEVDVVAIVERPAGAWVEEAVRVLRREAGRGARIRVFSAKRGSILRTSSGKLRRRAIWRAFADGQLDLTAAHDSGALSDGAATRDLASLPQEPGNPRDALRA